MGGGGDTNDFLELNNVVHSNLLLIMNHATRPESGYEVASC